MLCAGAAFLLAAVPAAAGPDYPITPVGFTKVRVTGGLWAARLETNRTATLPANFHKCEETGRIANFEKAAGLKEGKHEGIFFDDSDVYKVMEGAAYTLALHADPELDAYMDRFIATVAQAQEDDGYLYTARTIDPEKPAHGAGKERWADIKNAHELYCMGHMIEAAVAHHQATGKRNFLDVAVKCADMLDRTFGPDKRHAATGHPELELALARLYRCTGEPRYLALAKFFVDERGDATHRELYGLYYQDHMPFLQQTEAVGHAVRAGYFYCGAADVAALTGETAYIETIDRIWENAATRRMYLTGGIGSRREGEAFGDDFELPNATAYCETCAAIANALWNHRMFLLHGDAKYLDVFERTVYNGFLPGVSLEGDTFFYPNPLEFNGVAPFNHGSPRRSPWFGCSCCPTNIVRFIPSLPGCAYAVEGTRVYAGLYLASDATVPVGGQTVRIVQETEYPWEGAVRMTVTPEREGEFELALRIPGWARGVPSPGDLYTYLDPAPAAVTLSVNGEAVAVADVMDRGFAVLRRTWKPGDTVALDLAMPVRRVLCHEAVENNRGRVALERGPVVYCAEGVDNGGRALHLCLPDDAPLAAERRPDLLGGVAVLTGRARAVTRVEGGDTEETEQDFTAIPYYAWAHRDQTEMAVWLARTPDAVTPAPRPTLASKSRPSASHCWRGDTLTALNDQAEPKDSGDQSVPRMTWWDRRGTVEWVQYDLPEETEISGCAVYWFDDERSGGGCRVPASWRVLRRDGEKWVEVEKGKYGKPKRDAWCKAAFTPVKTDALRIEARLKKDASGGILEWTLDGPKP